MSKIRIQQRGTPGISPVGAGRPVLVIEDQRAMSLLLKDIADLAVEYDECQVPVTISIGLAIAPDDDLETLVRRADDKLYCAKEAGRNRLL
jgi:PleD family two-component response regulator